MKIKQDEFNNIFPPRRKEKEFLFSPNLACFASFCGSRLFPIIASRYSTENFK